MRRALKLVALVACVTACIDAGDRSRENDDASVPEELRFGGTAVVGFLAEASSMNEFASNDINSDELQSYVLFTTLVRYDEDLQLVPYLAESWETTSDGEQRTLTFHLRDAVKWHDGAPTTAYDVAFTFDRIKALGRLFPRAASFSNYDSAVVQDSFTVTFFLKPHPGFLDPWSFTSPMPQHILGDVPLAELQQDPFGSMSPVGNGPFRFVEHRPGDRWVFEATTDFPEALGGRPYVDRLVYRIIPEPTTMLAELMSGELDVYLGVAPSQVEQVESSPTARVLRYETRIYAFINWNARRPLFADPAVRRALTLGIDRERLVEAVRYGMGEVAYSPLPPYHWAHNSQLQPLPYDPDSARALLDAAGWVDSDGDGVRERDGDRASFELITNSNPVREDVLEIVASDLATVGVEVIPRVLEAQTLGATITGSDRDFDAFVLGWGPQFEQNDRRIFGCATPEGPFHWAGYCNPRVDELLDRVASLEDRAQALPLWFEYQEIIQRDQPYTFLYYETRAIGIKNRLRAVEMDVRGTLINVNDWWIEPGSRRQIAASRSP